MGRLPRHPQMGDCAALIREGIDVHDEGKVSNLRGAGKKPASVLPPPDND
jgi:hypothetical protein